MTGLLTDIYFWVGAVLFILSIAGIFWILKSLEANAGEDSAPAEPPVYEAPKPGTEAFIKTTRIESPPAQGPVNLESLAQQVSQIEETLSKIEKKMNEQNTDQLNEMAGQMKMIVQMLKSIQGGGGSESVAEVHTKVEKMYQILSSLSQPESK